ncbi:MAG: hypothetical protein OEY67_00405 [Gammaproteobacteria bacterium]|nr:hypothetical protein [Gammaproteobacteria bacterium]
MKYINDDTGMLDADGAEDALSSTIRLEQQIDATQRQIEALAPGHEPRERAELELLIAGTLVDLERGSEAFDLARQVFDVMMTAEDFEHAAIACDVMFKADQAESLAALGQGIWLGVTYPIDPEVTVALLQHIVDETPDDSDGAAVAMAAAHYVVDMRCDGKKRDDLLFFTGNLMGTVARRHSKIETQEAFDVWFRKMELHDPSLFLPRLRNIVDVMVQNDWWFDRDMLSEKLPVN